jgi:hypothetical protein
MLRNVATPITGINQAHMRSSGLPFTVLVTDVVGWTRSRRISLGKQPGEVTETDTSDLHR